MASFVADFILGIEPVRAENMQKAIDTLERAGIIKSKQQFLLSSVSVSLANLREAQNAIPDKHPLLNAYYAVSEPLMAAEREDCFSMFERHSTGPSVAGQLYATPVSEWLHCLRTRLSGRGAPILLANTPFEYAVRAAHELVCGDWGGAVDDLQRSSLTREEKQSLLRQAGGLTSTHAALMTQEQRSIYFTMAALEDQPSPPKNLEAIEECGGIVFNGTQPCLGFRRLPHNIEVARSLVDVGLVLSATQTTVRFDMLPARLHTLPPKLLPDYIVEMLAQQKLSFSRLRGYVHDLQGAQLTTQNHSVGHAVRAVCVAPFGTLGPLATDLVDNISLQRPMVWLTRFNAWRDPGTPLLTAQLTNKEVETLQVTVSRLPLCDPAPGETELVSSFKKEVSQLENEAAEDVARVNFARAKERARVPSDAAPNDPQILATLEEMKASGELFVVPPTADLPNDLGSTCGVFLGQDPTHPNRCMVTNYMCRGSSHGVLLQRQGNLCCVGFSLGKEKHSNYNLCINAPLVLQSETAEQIVAPGTSLA
eukprot:TRINITY_DN21705_c0_g4_i1.p1 TRINITY_DN21705_c0_g4~~TRINITY_DN21705_c0_g4_i1.p1  ORF type:complete len:545 (+),score=97.78 TRINITY_DN21705_c0_g4_i1:25-1635(+)